MALPVFSEQDLEKRRMLQEQRLWIASVLANDEASTDEELVAHFVASGVTPTAAAYWITKRSEFLGGRL